MYFEMIVDFPKKKHSSKKEGKMKKIKAELYGFKITISIFCNFTWAWVNIRTICYLLILWVQKTLSINKKKKEKNLLKILFEQAYTSVPTSVANALFSTQHVKVGKLKYFSKCNAWKMISFIVMWHLLLTFLLCKSVTT